MRYRNWGARSDDRVGTRLRTTHRPSVGRPTGSATPRITDLVARADHASAKGAYKVVTGLKLVRLPTAFTAVCATVTDQSHIHRGPARVAMCGNQQILQDLRHQVLRIGRGSWGRGAGRKELGHCKKGKKEQAPQVLSFPKDGFNFCLVATRPAPTGLPRTRLPRGLPLPFPLPLTGQAPASCPANRSFRAGDVLIVRIEQASRGVHTTGPGRVRSVSNGSRLRGRRNHTVHLYRYKRLFTTTPCSRSIASPSARSPHRTAKKVPKGRFKNNRIGPRIFHSRRYTQSTFPTIRPIICHRHF